MELDDAVDDDVAEQQVSTQSWSEQMDAVDAATVSRQQKGNAEVKVKQTAAATEHQKETATATEPEQATATATAEAAVVEETMTTVLVETATTDRTVEELATDNEADFIMVYRKRSHSLSPTRGVSKMMAASNSRKTSPQHPPSGRKRTQPVPVASGSRQRRQ